MQHAPKPFLQNLNLQRNNMKSTMGEKHSQWPTEVACCRQVACRGKGERKNLAKFTIFHQPGFPWNKGMSLTKPPFQGEVVWGRYNLTRRIWSIPDFLLLCSFSQLKKHLLFVKPWKILRKKWHVSNFLSLFNRFFVFYLASHLSLDVPKNPLKFLDFLNARATGVHQKANLSG